jgi:hypothetical protein
MSMRVQIALKGITDLEVLMEALAEMGIEPIRLDGESRGRNRATLLLADIGARRVGFQRSGSGELVMVGDHQWPIMRDRGFHQKMRQYYSLSLVKRKVREHQYHLASVETSEDGTIRVIARAWR